MKGLKEVKNRIRAVDSVSKITQAMQLVAASKMKRAQDFAVCSRPYLLHLSEIICCLSEKKIQKNKHPFFISREGRKRCIIVVGTDKGLCGVLNNALFKFIPREEEVSFISIGRKAMQFLSRNSYPLLASFSINDRVQYHEVLGICELISKLYLEGEIDGVEVLYPKFVNTLTYVPSLQRMLPMEGFHDVFNQMLKSVDLEPGHFQRDTRGLLFEPDVPQIIDHIAQIFLKYNLHQVLLEAKASEHSARMVAMKSATDNAESLSQELKLEYNKARQYAITNEIIELAASAMENS
ncbi:MAG: ATP synthase F1 subunit gamma [Puniceicoccales bacterium]|jgi:F-type H+-transporting ATPase subunit gamma|nr:ATP synthase F1 subunit gamma [Puniceicoccales bacterium]